MCFCIVMQEAKGMLNVSKGNGIVSEGVAVLVLSCGEPTGNVAGLDCHKTVFAKKEGGCIVATKKMFMYEVSVPIPCSH